MSAIANRVKATVAAVLKVPADTLTDGSSPDDIPVWDSMHHLQIILALEEEFGLQFSADEIDGLQTVGALTASVSERTG